MNNLVNEEKLEMLKAFLRGENIEYWEDVVVGDTGIVIPLFLPCGSIAVHVGDDDDWYKALRGHVRPVFIRDTDTAAFVIEKVHNTLCTFLVNRRVKGRKSRKPLTSAQRKMRRKRKNHRKAFLCSLAATNKVGVSEKPTKEPKK